MGFTKCLILGDYGNLTKDYLVLLGIAMQISKDLIMCLTLLRV